MSSGMKERLCRSLEKVLHAETRELPAAAGGILLFFLLFLAYSWVRSETAVAFYGYFRRFHRGPVFIRMGFLKGAEKGHSSVDVRFFHS